jgi:hypothetical protein
MFYRSIKISINCISFKLPSLGPFIDQNDPTNKKHVRALSPRDGEDAGACSPRPSRLLLHQIVRLDRIPFRATARYTATQALTPVASLGALAAASCALLGGPSRLHSSTPAPDAFQSASGLALFTARGSRF